MIRQRNPRSPRVLSVRPLVAADLETLHKPAARATLAKLRDSHHMVARLFASGLNNYEVAEASGYGYGRISLFRSDPAMVELVSRYRGQLDKAWLDGEEAYLAMVRKNRNMAERQLGEALEDAEESGDRLPVKELLAISRDAADRTGFGKVNKNLNVNVDFAAKLEDARRKSSAASETRITRRE